MGTKRETSQIYNTISVLLEKIQWRPEVEETLRNHAHKIRKHGLLR